MTGASLHHSADALVRDRQTGALIGGVFCRSQLWTGALLDGPAVDGFFPTMDEATAAVRKATAKATKNWPARVVGERTGRHGRSRNSSRADQAAGRAG